MAKRRQLKLYPRMQKKFENVKVADGSLRNRPSLKTCYNHDWIDLVSFRLCDAAKPQESYVDDSERCFTHVYSYNKVMSEADIAGISKILNKTNYRILAWYFDPEKTAKSGLRDFKELGRMPMSSTGSEKFTVYVYFRTFSYFNGIEEAWNEYDEEEEDEDEDEEDEEKE